MILKERKAFSMITAIFVIVMMSTVAMYIMNLSGKIVKVTTAQYQKEQAILYAKSYTEYAIMAVMSNDRMAIGNTCTNQITGTINNGTPADIMDDYTITTNISYIGLPATIGTCARQLGNPNLNDELNIIVDVYVSYMNLDDTNPIPQPIIYHRRTLQKI